MAEIHYVWVGPKKNIGDDFVGMDTVGADTMAAKYPDQEIVFWCLESQVAAYATHFERVPNIQVKAIEPYIKDIEGEAGEFYQFVEHQKKRAQIRAQGNDPATAIPELILIKASFFYWAAKHAVDDVAYLDSSITPDEAINSLKPMFEGLSGFCVPFVGFSSPDPDPWLMFIGKDDTKAEQRFNDYFFTIKNLMQDAAKDEIVEIKIDVRDEISNQFSIYSEDAKVLQPRIEVMNSVSVSGVTKVYLNSHRMERDSGPNRNQRWNEYRHWIYRYVESNDIQVLEYGIQNNYIEVGQEYPYAEDTSSPQTYISPLEFLDKKQQLLQAAIASDQHQIEHAKRIIKFNQWEHDKRAMSEFEHSNSTRVSNLHLYLAPVYPELELNKISEKTFHHWVTLILFCCKTVKKNQFELLRRSEQFGMMLAYSKETGCFDRAVDCAAPNKALSAYLARKIENVDVFCKTLSKLVRYVFQRRGLEDIKFESLAQIVEMLIETRKRSWTKPNYHILKSLTQSYIKNGPVTSDNASEYKAVMYGHISNIQSFFFTGSKAKMEADIGKCVDDASKWSSVVNETAEVFGQ